MFQKYVHQKSKSKVSFSSIIHLLSLREGGVVHFMFVNTNEAGFTSLGYNQKENNIQFLCCIFKVLKNS